MLDGLTHYQPLLHKFQIESMKYCFQLIAFTLVGRTEQLQKLGDETLVNITQESSWFKQSRFKETFEHFIDEFKMNLRRLNNCIVYIIADHGHAGQQLNWRDRTYQIRFFRCKNDRKRVRFDEFIEFMLRSDRQRRQLLDLSIIRR